VHVLGGALGHRRDDLAGGGIDDLLVVSAGAVGPFAADEQLVTLQRGAHWSLLAGGYEFFGLVTAATSANAAPTMSRPSSSCSSGMVNGISVRITLWWMPARSNISPRSRARASNWAVSVSAGSLV